MLLHSTHESMLVGTRPFFSLRIAHARERTDTYTVKNDQDHPTLCTHRAGPSVLSHSVTIPTPALVPTRSAPAEIISLQASSFLMPPAALTLTLPAATCDMRVTSSRVAPPAANPVEQRALTDLCQTILSLNETVFVE